MEYILSYMSGPPTEFSKYSPYLLVRKTRGLKLQGKMSPLFNFCTKLSGKNGTLTIRIYNCWAQQSARSESIFGLSMVVLLTLQVKHSLLQPLCLLDKQPSFFFVGLKNERRLN